jgi:hypothetical protein
VPDRLDGRRELHEPAAAQFSQVGCHAVGQVERGDQRGHDPRVRRERPWLGHTPQDEIAGRVRLERVVLDDGHQRGLRT